MKTHSIEDFQKIIKYKFKNIKYLKNALTHSSYANEDKKHLQSNERLEFLGDSVLSIIVSDYIFKNCPDYPEGELSKLRASLVCEKSLSEFAVSIKLGDFLFLSKGEYATGGFKRPSILADAFESVIAAIYLDGGLNEAHDFIMRFILPELKNPKLISFKDYKTQLQEIIQQNPEEKLKYVLTDEKGPDHNKHFIVEIHLNNNVIGKGGGHSKKDAEQQAAREALRLMGY